MCFSLLQGCKSSSPNNDEALSQAAGYFSQIPGMRQLSPAPDEISSLAAAKDAGVADADLLSLLELSRQRKRPFHDGESIAALLHAGVSEASVMALARLDQLGPFAGEAQLMRLAGLSDDVILALARRRNAGQPVLSSSKAAQLRNVQFTNAQILEAVNRGTTDSQAEAIIAQRERAGGGHSFVRQPGRRR